MFLVLFPFCHWLYMWSWVTAPIYISEAGWSLQTPFSSSYFTSSFSSSFSFSFSSPCSYFSSSLSSAASSSFSFLLLLFLFILVLLLLLILLHILLLLMLFVFFFFFFLVLISSFLFFLDFFNDSSMATLSANLLYADFCCSVSKIVLFIISFF